MAHDFLNAWVSVKAILKRPDGKVLLLKDAGSSAIHAHIKDKWDVPGGKMDAGEVDMLAAMAREVQEEISCDIAPYLKDARVVNVHVFKHYLGHHICIHFYEVSVPDAIDPALSTEHSEFAWVDPREALDWNLTPAMHDALNAYV